MEFGQILLASAILLSSITLSLINLKGSALIYSNLSSANNQFDCRNPSTEIVSGQKTSTVVFAASSQRCLFPNTYDHGDMRQSLSQRILEDVLVQTNEGAPN